MLRATRQPISSPTNPRTPASIPPGIGRDTPVIGRSTVIPLRHGISPCGNTPLILGQIISGGTSRGGVLNRHSSSNAQRGGAKAPTAPTPAATPPRYPPTIAIPTGATPAVPAAPSGTSPPHKARATPASTPVSITRPESPARSTTISTAKPAWAAPEPAAISTWPSARTTTETTASARSAPMTASRATASLLGERRHREASSKGSHQQCSDGFLRDVHGLSPRKEPYSVFSKYR
ncbi:hypothetical protein GFGA_1d0435 [Gluconobacter frateurii NBRC 103465]|nr:hypothetical protein GFGA_1d0435 [Gluconobacter frateurii NBRC 103465]